MAASDIYKKVVPDVIHGPITLTRVESRIIESAYYQRLRWIKQLGFSFYIFPGATHTRFAHAMGVTHVMDKVLRSIGKAVPEDKLYNTKNFEDKTVFHRTQRLAAMLHDIGTFPFSHTIELAYINHWRKQVQHRGASKGLAANHENLGIHIINNTDFPGGITRILKEEGIDPEELSKVIVGESQSILANQLLHSDMDADRMDYLLRDAYYTGVRIGLYDMDFLIQNLTVSTVDGQEILCVREHAINAVEYFLFARYSWYSQIINDGTGYKFDLMAAKIHEYFLENGLAYSFEQLIQQVSQNPNEYFTFNDSYFMAKLHEYLAGRITHPVIRELSEMLAYRQPPKQIKITPVEPTLIESEEHRQKLIQEVTLAAHWLKDQLKEIAPKAWMIFDIPRRDVMFTKNYDTIRKDAKGSSLLTTRDPIKILNRHNEPKLLIDISNSLMKILSDYRNFIPRIYVSAETYDLLQKKKVLDAMKAGAFRSVG